MEGFFGTYEKTLDAKGRVVVPNEYRSQIEGEELMLMKWFDDCVTVVPLDTWRRLADKMHRRGVKSASARSARRQMLSSSFKATLDGQGRIVIPTHLRTFARLKKDLFVIGDWDKFEIWDRELYLRAESKANEELNDNYQDSLADAYDEMVSEDRPEAGTAVELTENEG